MILIAFDTLVWNVALRGSSEWWRSVALSE